MKTLFTLLLVSFLSRSAFSQKIERWKEGRYYNLKGDRHDGLIFYDYHSSAIKFRETPESENDRLRPWEVRAFVMEQDSFSILKDFHYESPYGGRETEIMGFVQVLDTGFVKLYKHYATFRDQRNVAGPGVPGAALSWELENYLLLSKGAKSPMLVWKKNTRKFREQMMRYFQKHPEFVSKIESGAYTWESIPLLIKEFNNHKNAIQSSGNP